MIVLSLLKPNHVCCHKQKRFSSLIAWLLKYELSDEENKAKLFNWLKISAIYAGISISLMETVRLYRQLKKH